MTTFTRLTVVGTVRRAELVVPDDEPVGGLVPRLMELLDEPTGSVARPLTLVRVTGEELDAALSVAEQDLVDGEQLRFVRADEAPPPPEVADVTDVVGDTFGDRPGRWNARAREALGAVTLGAAGVLVMVVAEPGPALWWAGLLVGALAAVVAGRTGRRWTALALTAAAAGLAAGLPALPVSPVPSLTDAGTGAALVAAALAVWLVLGAGVGLGLRNRPALAGCALGALLIALPLGGRLLGLPTDRTVAVTAVAAVVACGLLPWYALSSSGLTGLDDQVLAGRPSRRRTVLATVDEAYRVLSWSSVAVALPLGVGSAWLVTASGRWTWVLGVVVVAVTALRSRAFPLVVQQLALGLAALAGTVALLVAGPLRLGGGGRTSLLVLGGVVVALAVGLRPAPHQRARLRRWGNLGEAVGVIALLPLLLAVFGVFDDLLGSFR